MKTMFKHHGTYGKGSKVENDIYLDIDGNEIEGVENIISNATLDADELLDALKQLDAAPPSGVASMIGDLTSTTQPKKYIGAEYQLRYYKNNSPNGVNGFEVTNNTFGVTRKVDIVPNPPPNITRIELKSWRSFEQKYWGGATHEFVKDLRQIDQLSDMRWSFDAKGSFTKNAAGNAYLKQNFMDMLGSDQGRAKLAEIPAAKANQLLGRADLSAGTALEQQIMVQAILDHLNQPNIFEQLIKIE